MQQKELMDMLEPVVPLVMLNGVQQQEAEATLKSPGFRHIYGLMLGSRQAFYASLSNARLGNAEQVTAAARIQGIISGIELFRDTVVSLTVPDGDDKEQNRG